MKHETLALSLLDIGAVKIYSKVDSSPLRISLLLSKEHDEFYIYALFWKGPQGNDLLKGIFRFVVRNLVILGRLMVWKRRGIYAKSSKAGMNKASRMDNALSWMEEGIKYVDQQLNWLDLAFFCLGILVLGMSFFILVRRKKEVLSEIVERYERDIDRIKKCHFNAITNAEKRIEAFKNQLKYIEIEYLKHFRKVEKEHQQVLSADVHSIFKLKEKIRHLRRKQLFEAEFFEKEINALKKEIQGMHKKHAEEIEQSEMEIKDLRKQLNTLIYKV